jgi:hypothetical protein
VFLRREDEELWLAEYATVPAEETGAARPIAQRAEDFSQIFPLKRRSETLF